MVLLQVSLPGITSSEGSAVPAISESRGGFCYSGRSTTDEEREIASPTVIGVNSSQLEEKQKRRWRPHSRFGQSSTSLD